MTVEQVVCVSLGSIINAIAFGLGVSVGLSVMKNKGL